jgi:hypothetical protein
MKKYEIKDTPRNRKQYDLFLNQYNKLKKKENPTTEESFWLAKNKYKLSPTWIDKKGKLLDDYEIDRDIFADVIDDHRYQDYSVNWKEDGTIEVEEELLDEMLKRMQERKEAKVAKVAKEAKAKSKVSKDKLKEAKEEKPKPKRKYTKRKKTTK